MGLWNYYFITKLMLYWNSNIDFHVIENVLFALYVLFPLKRLWVRRLRTFFAIPLGIGLFYHDSFFPLPERLIALTPNFRDFSLAYIAELLSRFINIPFLVLLLSACALLALLGRRLRLSTFTLIAIVALPWWHERETLKLEQASLTTPQACDDGVTSQPHIKSHYNNEELNGLLTGFYDTQATKKVSFESSNPTQSPQFDIILLHICSLSWDDIDPNERDGLFKRFDVLLKNFNSAASYSGPAAIRLLRASCGQEPHAKLYQEAPKQCYLFNVLEGIGYQRQLLLNHDGHFGGFLQEVQNVQQGGLNVPLWGDLGAKVQMHSFDGTPIYEDFDILSRWWAKRKARSDQPVALYYNTISLHDGDVLPGQEKISSIKSFPTRMHKLMQDIDGFTTTLEQTGRPVALILVAEHGAALHGDTVQIPGMRELPSPRITLVPAAIKFIGIPGFQSAHPVISNRPTSYLALTELIKGVMVSGAYGGHALDLEGLVNGLSETEYVSENEQTVVLGKGSKYYLHEPNTDWMDYKVKAE